MGPSVVIIIINLVIVFCLDIKVPCSGVVNINFSILLPMFPVTFIFHLSNFKQFMFVGYIHFEELLFAISFDQRIKERKNISQL